MVRDFHILTLQLKKSLTVPLFVSYKNQAMNDTANPILLKF
jgi:hypothetical protein